MSPEETPSTAVPTYDTSLPCYVLLGIFFSLWFFGILSYQILYFYTNYPNERKWLRAFVGALVLVDVVQTIMGAMIIWALLTKHPKDPGAVGKFIPLLQIYPVHVGLVSGSVQIFFAWRIRVLSTNLVPFIVAVMLAIPQFAGGIAYTVLTAGLGYPVDCWSSMSVILASVSSSVVCDIFITAALTMVLRRHRAGHNLGAAAHLVHNVKTVSVHSSFITILWSLALLITLVATKRGVYQIFFYPLGKVYLITMFASLNSRPVIRPELDPRIHSVLQRGYSPRPSTTTLHPLRGPTLATEHGEKITRPFTNHPQSAGRTAGYLPVTEEETDDVICIERTNERPSNESDEVKLLVRAPPPKESPSSSLQGSVSSRPRGPRPLAPASCASRSTSV